MREKKKTAIRQELRGFDAAGFVSIAYLFIHNWLPMSPQSIFSAIELVWDSRSEVLD